MKYHFETALLPGGWSNEVQISVDENGNIASVETGVQSDQNQISSMPGIALPGFTNSHSHAFQRAFAGLSEYRSDTDDSFWSWRKLMYQFLETLNPDQCYSIAKELYGDMLSAGYTSVGEFHYVHNTPEGKPYDNLCELSDATIQAAVDAGINICFLPVLYQQGGFDGSELTGGQKRFYLSDEQFLELVRSLRDRWNDQPNVKIGMAHHSLRAVTIETVKRVSEEFKKLLPDGPIHIHVAEQQKEVEDCIAILGRLPVKHLMNNAAVDKNWCLIHATHMTREETRLVAESGATICVCPTTEANLGDGVFGGEEYLLEFNGQLAIGSDSHIAIDPFSELRTLEYGHRLKHGRRAILCDANKSVGRYLFDKVASGGPRSLGLNTGSIAVGKRADFIIANRPHNPLSDGQANNVQANNAQTNNLQTDRILDYLMFNEFQQPINQTIVGGKVIAK